ncbi:MAG TPA: amidase family protein [Rhizomicrobium sp.]|nr:amidase family protein [Rhizomicrobium sp.]
MSNTYNTARQMLADLQTKKISARELLDAHLAENDALHKKLNAVVATDIPRAVKDAAAIDDARAKGANPGALAGLPMTIKDGYDVEGLPATAGNTMFANRPRNCADAELVSRARKAGAVIWGKTNVPFMLSDFQSYNDIYGTTNNPYDTSRVPGGSSGGAAAALATGITSLEIGSDIGGSLRHPANFCGVCSLKPTWGVLPMRGHVPPPPGFDAEVDLGVGGPMARNVDDLKLLWSVLSNTPEQKRRDAKGTRIAVLDEQSGWVLDESVKARVEAAADALSKAGMTITRAKPDIDMEKMVETYLDLLTPIISAGFPDALLQQMAKTHDADVEAVREGRDPEGQARYRLRATATPTYISTAQKIRQAQKDALARFFDDHDAILMPITPIPAFAHDHSPINERTITVNGKPARYMSMLNWIALATSLHAPALALQAGQTPAGLPVGVQLVGREDGEGELLNLGLAAEEVLGGFRSPPL